MTLRQVIAPEILPVTLAEVKAHRRITHNEEDALLELLIRAALAHVEKWCSKAFITQTWEQVLDRFPTHEIGLGLGPVVAVEFVSYTGSDGLQATVSQLDYRVDDVSGEGWVVPVSGFSWPAALETINAVQVRFIVGADVLTDNLRAAILMIVGHWYEHREAAMPVDLKEIPIGAQSILNLHRTMFV